MVSFQIGDHAMGKVGPLVYATKPDGTLAKRKSKTWVEGVIIQVIGPQEFIVQFQVGSVGTIIQHQLTSNQL